VQQPSPGPKRRLSPRRSQRSRSATARHPGETARRSGGSCGGRWLPSLAAGPDAAIALVAPRHPDADPVRHARRENLPSSHHGHLATPGGGTCLARIPGRARPAGCRHPRARRRFAGTLRVVRIARPEIEELLDLGGQPLRTMWLATVDGTPKRWLATPPGAARHARLRLTVLSEIPVARATAAIPPPSMRPGLRCRPPPPRPLVQQPLHQPVPLTDSPLIDHATRFLRHTPQTLQQLSRAPLACKSAPLLLGGLLVVFERSANSAQRRLAGLEVLAESTDIGDRMIEATRYWPCGGRQGRPPARAAFRPACVRSRISWRSNSPIAPKMWNTAV